MKHRCVQTPKQAYKLLKRMGGLQEPVTQAGMRLAKRLGEKHRMHHDVAAFVAVYKLPNEAKYINFGIKVAEHLMNARIRFSGRLVATTQKTDREIWPTWGY